MLKCGVDITTDTPLFTTVYYDNLRLLST